MHTKQSLPSACELCPNSSNICWTKQSKKKLFTKPDLHAYERVKNRQKKAHTHRHLSIVAIFRKSFQNNDDEINKKLAFLFLKPYDERQFKRFDTLSSLHLTKKKTKSQQF